MKQAPAPLTMSNSRRLQSTVRRICFSFTVVCLLALGLVKTPSTRGATTLPPINTVFIILMENHDWSEITPSQAPYIRNTLVPMGAVANQFFNPPGIHPSLPNYLWLEAGDNLGILDDNDPSSDHQSTTQHLVTMLTAAGISWKAYQEDITGTSCPLNDFNNYAVRHDPFVYFDDVTNNLSSSSANCIQHIRPFTELANDLKNNTVARYNFITPNACNDMHDCSIKTGDTWLANNVPAILNSTAYKNGGVLFLTWDESENSDGPIGMVVVSPFAKVNYSNSIHYDHSSTLRTIQEIFNVTPLLRDAANATDLSDLFTTTTSSKPQPPTNLKATVK
jgi:phospholipase C